MLRIALFLVSVVNLAAGLGLALRIGRQLIVAPYNGLFGGRPAWC